MAARRTKFYLDKQNGKWLGVCAGIADYTGIDVVWIRVGAVVVTLDAPPMNEMITPERGILVPYSRTGTQHLATTYHFDDAALEAAIARAIATDTVRCEAMGAAARAWYDSERAAFPARLDDALRGTVAQA